MCKYETVRQTVSKVPRLQLRLWAVWTSMRGESKDYIKSDNTSSAVIVPAIGFLSWGFDVRLATATGPSGR